MKWITAIGLIGAACTTISFLPQALKTWKLRKAEDISLGMYVLFVSGVALWLIYGFLIKDTPLIYSNAITLLLAGSVLYMKIKYG
ncbi:MAG: hypothetical protein A3H69_02980 [Candidatus Sungbacteria bacterium RIFCSPLOWO2_02_FULL_47_9]|uniref:MtN3 and saliva related transmembrane protein n=1 Tax=Candidatus Sungbacteria bacterium RIFCSPHIGHO2_01_FULL_47_32 TaxID=1802264 RepID=A0A1G2K5Z8_9BACT|nr:MAG: hypothetical protein UX72_C0042G0010 [Parcubacteria group bacterium GW2011_GWA2_47_10]OGZ94864.1 MAG: hypothetical protein A2633_00085 [Candidatus Sungbacteria bacterium RIFCSPHIGHO2_01_FULL_47_32]OGZ99024.1 MAG: hypothetical protein A3D57_04820 [Candidatus Sungbacteria bacterium RIFCSPHIGHO2_02_FULL_46_12]OHA10579.1 MAG: hypothetical protein A3H69_02980 [Candidatus Sungbacteria bacterium RIFCSPLOWO2_02_FULL_47_9]